MSDKLAALIHMIGEALPKGMEMTCPDLDRLYAGETDMAQVLIYCGDDMLVIEATASDRMFLAVEGEERIAFRATHAEDEMKALLKIIRKWKRKVTS